VCNVITDDEHIVAVVTPSVGAGPFHVLLSEEVVCSDLISPRAEIWLTPHEIHLGTCRVILTEGEGWSPTLRWPAGNHAPLIRVLRSLLLARRESDRWSHLIRDRIGAGLQSLLSGLKARRAESVHRGVDTLMGLGPGLTPAGDDVLLGVIAALQAQGTEEAQELLFPAVRQILGHTTRLSALWLMHALEGQYSQPWHELARAWEAADIEQMRAAARRILQTGATSGYYALLGFSQTLGEK